MLEDYQLIAQFINESRLSLVESQSSKGLRASGKSANSLQVTIGENFGQLIDTTGSFYYQEFGRKAGKYPPFKVIYDWVALKKYGIQYNTEKKHLSITYAIMHNMKLKGTYTAQHGQTNVLTDVINRERINALKGAFAKKYSSQIKSDVIKEFKPKN